MFVNPFDVIIVGGSYAGLSAAMALGRSLRNVLIIDSGQPCNAPTPHAHNFITHDGETPKSIAENAKAQVLQYPTVQFFSGKATSGVAAHDVYTITTAAGDAFQGKKLLFTTGVKDIMPDIEGFAACWGKSILHCPYCHGYEVTGEAIGLLGNGDLGFELGRMLHQWSKNLTLFTNGKASLSAEQKEKLEHNKITIIEKEIEAFEHKDGYMQQVILKDGSRTKVTALFAKAGYEQHCPIPQQLGCQLSDQGLLVIDAFQQTTLPGIYAAGDNSDPLRALPVATAAGTKAGAFINRALIMETF